VFSSTKIAENAFLATMEKGVTLGVVSSASALVFDYDGWSMGLRVPARSLVGVITEACGKSVGHVGKETYKGSQEGAGGRGQKKREVYSYYQSGVSTDRTSR